APSSQCEKTSKTGTAVELNCNYRDFAKVMRDVQKLIDPENKYSESLYFAFGTKPQFFECVKHGLQRAFDYFFEGHSMLILPIGFHVVVAEASPDNYLVRETSVKGQCTPNELLWSENVI